MIPWSDEPRDPEHWPVATWALMLVNVLVALATLVRLLQGENWLDTWALHTAAPTLATGLTSMVLHAGFGHLFGNLWVLSIYGPNVERRLSPVPFVLLYVTAGVLSGLAFTLLSLGTRHSVVGASGAISGVLGAYLVFFPGNAIRMIGPMFIPFRLPAWVVLAAYVVWDNFVPMVWGEGSHVAYGAHLGGFAAGMVLALGVGMATRAGEVDDAAQGRWDRAESLWRQGMVVDAHRAMRDLSAGPEPWAARAKEKLTAYEQDPRLRGRL